MNEVSRELMYVTICGYRYVCVYGERYMHLKKGGRRERVRETHAGKQYLFGCSRWSPLWRAESEPCERNKSLSKRFVENICRLKVYG